MKQRADKGRQDLEFKVGEWVVLKLQPYRQVNVFKRTSHKLSHKFFGPFKVIKKVGSVAYRLRLPEGSRIHPVFYISKLKFRIGDDMPRMGSLPPMHLNGELQLQPDCVLGQRVFGAEQQSLIQWSGLTVEEATWESDEQLMASFPLFNLEDKVCLGEWVLIELLLTIMKQSLMVKQRS